jgi:uncharacterized protein
MKLQPDKPGTQSITAYGPGWVSLSGERLDSSIVIGSRGERLDWNCKNVALLTLSHFESIAVFEPELLIFGSGNKLVFPDPRWLLPLASKRIGIETMDTQAACRTYNILAAEGRHVIAALLLEVN